MKPILLFLIYSLTSSILFSQSGLRDIDNILPVRNQIELYNKNLEWKLDNLLPGIMRREKIDMWIIICFENSEDPVYRTLNTWPGDGARRLSILIFHDSRDGFKKLSATWHGSYASGYMYQNIFTDRSKGPDGQFIAVADYIRKADPQKIAIDYDTEILDDFSHANGLSHFHYEKLFSAIDEKFRPRLTSAKKVILGWYETRSPWEISFYRHVCGLAHDLINEFFSNGVIIPDVTTNVEVQYHICERILELKLNYWFFPSVDIVRSQENIAKYGRDDNVIRRGDMLHCDVGISYLGLSTDMQHNAYVCRSGETDAPAGIKALFEKGKRLQNIILEEMKEGRTGNDILKFSLDRGKKEDLSPVIYSHPVNYYGHGSGLMIGFTERQDPFKGTGEHTLYPNTSYSMEFSVSGSVPEWNNEVVRLGVEDDIIFTKEGAAFIDGRQEKIYLIR
jgi:Xaa-Pro aminopeptidase